MDRIFRRRSIRLPGFDYSTAGAYFVTICAKNRQRIFGEVADGRTALNKMGQIVMDGWRDLPNYYPSIEIDEFIVMPDHFHGIFWILPQPTVGAGSPRPYHSWSGQGAETAPIPKLGDIMGFFKYQTTKSINQAKNTPGLPVWQRGYYDRIIRDEAELAKFRRYIQGNPVMAGNGGPPHRP